MKKFLWDVGYKLLGLIVSIVVAAVAFWLADPQYAPRLIVSLLGSVLSIAIVEFLKREREIKELRGEVDKLSSVLSDKYKTDHERSQLLRAPIQELNLGEVSERWIELLWRMQLSYSATNYIREQDMYLKPYAKLGLAVQATKIKVQQTPIKKVFIIDTPPELLALCGTLESQQESGIDVRYVFFDTIMKHKDLADQRQKLDNQIDFGLLDSDTVLVWLLDERRFRTGGRVLFGASQFEPYRRFFKALFDAAKPFVPVAIKRLSPDDVKAIESWPPYKDEIHALDYALRGRGWLHEFAAGKDTHHFGAWSAGMLAGFSILLQTSEHTTDMSRKQAEIYIALRADKLNQGLGLLFMQAVLQKGFDELGFDMIHLKVRRWHAAAIKLYERLGFLTAGEKVLEIDGKEVQFLVMELNRPEGSPPKPSV